MRIHGVELRAKGSGFRVLGSGFRVRVWVLDAHYQIFKTDVSGFGFVYRDALVGRQVPDADCLVVRGREEQVTPRHLHAKKKIDDST